jgi:glyoxalase family protein
MLITGIHHVTAIASGARQNVEFYAGILGLRLVKRTVNFDATDVHHLYYGDENGSPGSIMTFFPYEGLQRGRKGKGQVTVTSFSIGAGSLDHWMKRFDRLGVKYKHPQERFGNEAFLYFEDADGLGLELVEAPDDDRPLNSLGPVAKEHSIKGFFGITLSEESFERTAGLLTEHMDHRSIKEGSDRFRFSPSGKPGDIVDIINSPEQQRGFGGSGTVHHVAFSTSTYEDQLAVREKLLSAGHQVTQVLDRQYFRSIYFREPGGVLFEVATVPPGFAIDETPEQLGTSLKLPAWVEPQRTSIEASLVPINVDLQRFMD